MQDDLVVACISFLLPILPPEIDFFADGASISYAGVLESKRPFHLPGDTAHSTYLSMLRTIWHLKGPIVFESDEDWEIL